MMILYRGYDEEGKEEEGGGREEVLENMGTLLYKLVFQRTSICFLLRLFRLVGCRCLAERNTVRNTLVCRRRRARKNAIADFLNMYVFFLLGVCFQTRTEVETNAAGCFCSHQSLPPSLLCMYMCVYALCMCFYTKVRAARERREADRREKHAERLLRARYFQAKREIEEQVSYMCFACVVQAGSR